jgi:hypothetical protein
MPARRSPLANPVLVKRSTTVPLTLVTTLAALGCGPSRPSGAADTGGSGSFGSAPSSRQCVDANNRAVADSLCEPRYARARGSGVNGMLQGALLYHFITTSTRRSGGIFGGGMFGGRSRSGSGAASGRSGGSTRGGFGGIGGGRSMGG